MRKRGILLIIVIVILFCNIVFAQDFDISLTMPSSVQADEEFDVIIDVDVINPVSNGLFVAATVPSELVVLSSNPNGLLIGNVVMWTINPFDSQLVIRAKANVNGEYNITVKTGTYYKTTDTYDETYDDGILTVAGDDVWSLIDLNNNGVIETNELLEGINKWINDEDSTSILLEAINIWIG